MKIVLLGYMGSGKSTVGKKLADLLEYPFMDLDSQIEVATGKSISDIFSENGEIYFRRKESECLKVSMEKRQDLVLATGGGTPCYGANLSYVQGLEDVITIYLKVALPELTDRLFKERDSRPLIGHLNSKELLNDFIRKHLFERAFYYNQASMVIDTDGLAPKNVAEKIVASLF